jgi:hypothetical protein
LKHTAGHAQQCCLPHLGLETFKRSIFFSVLLLLSVNTYATAAATRYLNQAIAAAITVSSYGRCCCTMP